MKNHAATILAAFAHAASEDHRAPGERYLERCLAQRVAGSPSRAGSWYDLPDTTALLVTLLGADWEVYDHPAIKSPAVGFRAPIAGKLGMLPLRDLPRNAEIHLTDPKGGEEYWTGERSVSASVVAERWSGVSPVEVEFTTLILGPSVPGVPDSALTVWTFHPGQPVRPSSVARITPEGEDLHGKVVPRDEAIRLGFDLAKLV